MLFSQIKTPSLLKTFVEAAPGGSHYFDRSTMRFFGDTMRNYGVRHLGKGIVELYRKRAVHHGLESSSYWKPSEDGSYALRVYRGIL